MTDVVVAHGESLELALLGATLDEAGFSVRTAATGEAALGMCRERRPDVLLIEEQLELLGRLKRDPSLFDVAVVLIVGQPTAGQVVRDLERGALDVVTTPLRQADVVARVHSAARTKHLQDELLQHGRGLEDLLFGDPLTKLYNRRFILTQLTADVNSARRHGRDIVACIIDVDHFKEINDSFGHAAGDQALVQIAERLAARVREEDQLGRIGGEEFLLLLPDTGSGEAGRVADDLRAAIADRPLIIDGTSRTVTVSIGWASWDGEEEASDLLRRADEALYQAKQEGRNRVCGPPGVSAGQRFRRR